MHENTIKAVLAAALGALCSYALQLVIPVLVLVAVMLLDYVTGMAKAYSSGQLSSRIGLLGILKKLGYLVIVEVAGVVAWLIRYGLASVGVEFKAEFLIAVIVIVWLVINELISILENVAALGGPVPEFLRKLIRRLKVNIEQKTAQLEDGDDNA